MYKVVGCSNCESVKIAVEDDEKTVCNRCQNQIDVADARAIFRSENLEEAKEARSMALARQQGFDGIADEIVEGGIVSENVGDRFGEDELMEDRGIDTDAVEEAGEVNRETTDGDSKPQTRIVKDAVEFLDEPTDEDVAEFAEERGVDRDKAFELVDKLCMEGEAMRTREGVVQLL
ncbi:hypothetical protein EGH25_09240 [Haladaptatus sp. F3-133]|uniref:DUF5817 domain-containing protein n=1 Tax=Halorutilus salinus TaxID=2487751 RepID=A0A9Q4GH72_9EURY|nr:hypothetical protein [Halorutilus salinus]MCX2819532.1 hypothetical protein [Halorutilus salinus]